MRTERTFPVREGAFQGASNAPHLVTAVAVTPANAADGEVTARLVQERRKLIGQAPAQVLGDTA